MKTIGILYHPKLSEGKPLADKLAKKLRAYGQSPWVCSAWEEQTARSKLDGTDMVIAIGGDGTILRASRLVLTQDVPIVGINMGRLGFMTEMTADEVDHNLPLLLEGKGWLDKRAMLQATLTRSGRVFHALNDVVIGRGAIARVISIEVKVDGVPFTTYRADAVILASATGSTAYSLAAGGPVLHPQSQDILLQPLACHLGPSYGLIFPENVTLQIEVESRHQAILNIDGQSNLPLENNEIIEVKHSPHVTSFLRMKPPTGAFYGTLAQRLAGK